MAEDTAEKGAEKGATGAAERSVEAGTAVSDDMFMDEGTIQGAVEPSPKPDSGGARRESKATEDPDTGYASEFEDMFDEETGAVKPEDEDPTVREAEPTVREGAKEEGEVAEPAKAETAEPKPEAQAAEDADVQREGAKPAGEEEVAISPIQMPGESAAVETLSEEEQQSRAEEARAARATAEQKIAEAYREGITDEENDLLLTDPREGLSRLAARLFMDVQEATIRNVVHSFPHMLSGHLSQEQQKLKDAEQFYNKWPKLRTKEGIAAVDSYGRAWLQANQGKGTKAKFIEEVGAMASIALKLPIAGVPGTEVVEPPKSDNLPPPKPAGTGPRPARTGQGVKPKPGNEWEEMADEYLQEDQEY